MSAHSNESWKALIYEQRGFISNLEKHHASLGTLFRNIPVLPINISLFSLYHCVRRLGGFNEVTKSKQWANIAKQLGYPPNTIPRVAHLLCYQYSQLLFSFELSHSNSPDRNPRNTQLPDIVIPALYASRLDEVLAEGHDLTTYVKTILEDLGGLTTTGVVKNGPDHFTAASAGLVKKLSLTRLRCSLASGFPNEVEVAISSLVILSSKKQLKLKHEKNVLDLLLAHVGLFKGDEVWGLFQFSGYAGRHQMDKIWAQVLTPDTYMRYIIHPIPLSPDSLLAPEYCELLSPHNIPEQESYLYRLYSVATILYNASYTEDNCTAILEHSQSIRFLLASLKCSNVILQHFAWDALCVISDQVALCSSELEAGDLAELLIESLYSKDRFVILRDLEVTRSVASLLDISLPQELLAQILKLLTLNDVQVILRGIETLYQLTESSISTCSQINSTPHGIDTLITCLTRELDSLACNTSDKFAMIKEVNREEEQSKGVPEHIHYSITSLYDDTNRHSAATTTPPNSVGEGQGFGPDEMAKKWLRACFEMCIKGTVSKTQLYSGYHNYLKNVFQIQSSLGFMRLLEHIRHFFPRANLKKSTGADGKSSFVFHNLRVKQHISLEDISHPSVIVHVPAPAPTPSRQKISHLTKISPQLQYNHIHNHRMLPGKPHSSTDLSRTCVIKNIFGASNRGPLSPPLKSPPLPTSNDLKLPSPPIPVPIPLKPTPTPPEKDSDAMILQIPIEIYNNNSTTRSPGSPKSDSAEHLVNGFIHNRDHTTPHDGHNINLKKRTQPPSSSPYDQSPKKIPPSSPTHLLTSPKYSFLINNNNTENSAKPILENGYDPIPQLPNEEVSKSELPNNSEQKETKGVDDITDPSPPMNTEEPKLEPELRPDKIVCTEFPMVSISLLHPPAQKDQAPEDSTLPPVSDPSPKPSSPLAPVPTPPPTPVANSTPETPNTEEVDALVTRKVKKLSRDRASTSTPMCQWHECSKSFDSWEDLLSHACREHAQVDYPTICLWVGCKTHRNTRSRPSLMRHFQVSHCTPNPISIKLVSVSNLLDQLKHIPPMEKYSEGTLSRSLHLTTALILRNIVKYCPESINNFILHEDTLLSVATTDSQAGPYIAELLSLLSNYQSQVSQS